MRVYIDDNGRYKTNSGYANLSRNFGKALSHVGIHAIYAPTDNLKWHSEVSTQTREAFEQSTSYGSWNNADIALTICPPRDRAIKNIPNIIYTQNALAGFKSAWGTSIAEYDGVIVPGQFDVPYVSQWNSSIYTCPQLVDTRIFVNRPVWREEGSKKFTFIFVGSFSYRKGIDLLIQSFCEFSLTENNSSKLVLICPGVKNINYLLSSLREHNSKADIDIYIDDMSQEWVCRHINRADVFISLSRGEGWCMPFFESILAQKPCIVPDSTAMGEFSKSFGSVIKVPVQLKRICEIESHLGQGFKNTYQENNTCSYDTEINDAVQAMRNMKIEYSKYLAVTADSRRELLAAYSYEKVGQILKDILASHLHASSDHISTQGLTAKGSCS